MPRLPFLTTWIGLGLLAGCAPKFQQNESCRCAMEVYESVRTRPKASLDDLGNFSDPEVAEEMNDAYGETGSCWTADDAVAKACIDECEEFLLAVCDGSFQVDAESGPPTFLNCEEDKATCAEGASP